MLPVGRCRGYRTVTSALARSQLCRVPEDLAAFPDATGRRSHRGPRHQPAVTRRGPPGVGHAFDLSLTDLFFFLPLGDVRGHASGERRARCSRHFGGGAWSRKGRRVVIFEKTDHKAALA